MTLPLLTAALLSVAPAPSPELAATASEQPFVDPVRSARKNHLGLMLDVGVPDGAAVSLGYRPWSFLRLHAGPVSNGAGFGARAGLTLFAFSGFVTPTLSAEVGRIGEGDGNRVVRAFTGNAQLHSPMLDRVGYDFGNLHAGLELGASRRFSFFLRAGMSHVRTTLHGFESTVRAMSRDDSIDVSSPRLALTAPSAKLGFAVYFF